VVDGIGACLLRRPLTYVLCLLLCNADVLVSYVRGATVAE
jgi:hypothetical protein